MARRRRNKPEAAHRQWVRIIGGRWRGRRLPVADADTLRPTKDMVRETLFNWLAPHLPGARCLDAFAGSGALGFEAASRGAGEVVMLESAPALCGVLREQARQLEAGQVRVQQADALMYLRGEPAPFDIVFLDPPFGEGLLQPACELLAGGRLNPGARVYLEAPREEGLPELPGHWRWLREKTAGEVAYGLARPLDPAP